MYAQHVRVFAAASHWKGVLIDRTCRLRICFLSFFSSLAAALDAFFCSAASTAASPSSSSESIV